MKKRLLALGVAATVFALGVGVGSQKVASAIKTEAATTVIYSGVFLKGEMNGWLIGKSGAQIQETYGTTYSFQYSHEETGSHYFVLRNVPLVQNSQFGIDDWEHNLFTKSFTDTSQNNTYLTNADTGDKNLLLKGAAGNYDITYKYWKDNGDHGIITNIAPSDNTAATEINRWANDFLTDTNTICADNGATNHKTQLEEIWCDPYASNEVSIYGLKGSHNNWADPNPNYMFRETGTTGVYSLANVTFGKNAEFKIIKEGNFFYPYDNYLQTEGGVFRIELRTDGNYENTRVALTRIQYLADSYAALSSDAKNLFVANSEDPDVKDAYDRYKHIVERYGLSNFASITITPAAALVAPMAAVDDNTTVITVSAVGGATLLGVAGLFFVRRRRLF